MSAVIFFEDFYHALKKEDAILYGLMSQHGTTYNDRYCGVGVLFETIMVYLGYRRYLERGGQAKVTLEEPYPGNPRMKMDVTFWDSSEMVIGVIEAKYSQSPSRVLPDLRERETKLHALKVGSRYRPTYKKHIILVWSEDDPTATIGRLGKWKIVRGPYEFDSHKPGSSSPPPTTRCVAVLIEV